ncbi:hypothetical protein Hanom_Chr11g00975401 [Helianthus anomalus]
MTTVYIQYTYNFKQINVYTVCEAEYVDGRVDSQSTKALLTNSGTSSCGQCPACRFTTVVFG